jgi:hypothetical protein
MSSGILFLLLANLGLFVNDLEGSTQSELQKLWKLLNFLQRTCSPGQWEVSQLLMPCS